MIRGTEAMDQQIEGKPRFGRWAWGAGLVLVLLLLAVLLTPGLRGWARAERSVSLDRLRLATVVRGDLERDVSVQGRIVAAFHPKLFSPEEGIVTLEVRPGQVVARGDRLAEVASPELASDLARERSRLQSLESQLARQRLTAERRRLAGRQEVELFRVRREAAGREQARAERLRAEGLLNESDYERAQDELRVSGLELASAEDQARLEAETLDFELRDRELEVERQRLAVEELERRIGRLTISAPFDGMVASLEVQDRDAVAANQALLTVVDLSAMEVELRIPEAFADDVAPGTEAAILYDGREHRGEVTSISPEVTSSLVEGRAVFFGEPPAGLKQSQRVSTRLILEHRRDVLKVPRGPFLETGAGRQIYVLEDGLATLRSIEVGATSVGEVEIVRGLAEGERILLGDVSRFDGAGTVLVRK